MGFRADERVDAWVVDSKHTTPVKVVHKDTLGRVLSEGWHVVPGPDAVAAESALVLESDSRIAALEAELAAMRALVASLVPAQPDVPLIGLPPTATATDIVETHATEAAKATAARNGNARSWVKGK